MSCEFDKGLIAALYDGETTPEERAEAERHLATCPECARDFASMKDLSGFLKPLGRASAPLSIEEGVMREIRATRRVHRSWVTWGATAAAAALLAVGTAYLLDQRAAPVREESLAKSEPARAKHALRSETPAAERTKDLMQEKGALEKPAEGGRKEPSAPDPGFAQKPAASTPAPPPAPPPPPAAEPEKREADKRADEYADKDAPQKDGEGVPLFDKLKEPKEAKKPVVPVLKVTAANVALARLEVEAFLKERELKKAPAGAPLLGRSSVVRDRYLQVELSEEESKALEKRLAALKGTELTVGSFEDEKKRVAEEESKQKNTLGARSGDDAKEEKSVEEYVKPNGEKDAKRGVPAKKPVERKNFILVFEVAPPKK